MSAFETVVVYPADIGRKIIDDNQSVHRMYHLPYALLRISGPITEEAARTISRALRLYDELILAAEDELIVFLSMVTPTNVPFVHRRLEQLLPGHRIAAIDKAVLK